MSSPVAWTGWTDGGRTVWDAGTETRSPSLFGTPGDMQTQLDGKLADGDVVAAVTGAACEAARRLINDTRGAASEPCLVDGNQDPLRAGFVTNTARVLIQRHDEALGSILRSDTLGSMYRMHETNLAFTSDAQLQVIDGISSLTATQWPSVEELLDEVSCDGIIE